MTLDLADKSWLEAFVASELDRYDPEAARARLPDEVRAPAEGAADLASRARLLAVRSLRLRRLHADALATFEDAIRGHVQLVLDLALVAGAPGDPALRRTEIAAFLAAAAGASREAIAADPGLGPSPKAVARALRAAGERLAAQLFPPGDPVGGLPLYPGVLAVSRRHVARVALGAREEGRLDPEALARDAAFAEREIVLLAEALAAAEGPPADRRIARVRRKQLARYGLSRRALRAARAAIERPRTVEALGVAVPEPVRPFLLEQLALAQLRAGPAAGALPAPAGAPGPVDAFAQAAGFNPEAVAAAKVEAAAQHGDHLIWFEAVDGDVDWDSLADEWEARADMVVDRVTTAVTENLGALVTEIRETGELGQLLARAAAGHVLTREERRKVKAQLIDLAKAVPALAIFAAPGGSLLLPILAKLLPFSVLPSAWDKPSPARPALPAARPGSSASAATSVPAAASAVAVAVAVATATATATVTAGSAAGSAAAAAPVPAGAPDLPPAAPPRKTGTGGDT